METSGESHILTEPVSMASCPKCGAMLEVGGLLAFTAVQCSTCEFEFQVPARFGAFLLLQLLGAGGMGGVYRARDEGLNREVAIKVMLQSLGEDQNFVETFQREAQAAARLNHPHIAQIYSFGQVYGQPFIVMELVSGGSLDKMMASQGPLDPAVVIHVGTQIAEGLREASEAGLVHGDVKPENILFDLEKNAKLVDFGLAAMQSGPGNEVWGTPFYIAPEKVRRQKTDFRSDIYSLGATLYHAIAGVPPFDGADATAVVKARFDGPPKSLRDIRGSAIPEEVEALIMRMLEVEPQMRFPTYGSLLGDMRRYLSKVGPVNISGNSKKIMIKGKRPKDMTGKVTTTGALNVATTGELPEGMVPVGELVEENESEAAAGKRGCKVIALVGVGLMLLLGALVGGFFGVRYYLRTKQNAAIEAKNQKLSESAKASIAKSVAEARKAVERVQGYVPDAIGYAEAAAEAVVAVLGEGVRPSMVPPDPTPEAEEPPAEAAAGAATNAAAPAAEAAAAPAAEAAAAPAAEAVAAPAAEGGAAQVPVVERVRDLYLEAFAVRAAAKHAERLLKAIEAKSQEGDALSKDTARAEELAKLANALVEQVKGLVYAKDIAEAPRRVAMLKKAVESVRADVGALVEQQRLKEEDRKKREKAEAEAEKRRLEMEALKEKAQNEVASVAAVEESNAPLLKQLQFREALRALKAVSDGLETKGGLDALALAEERVNRIKEFHEYLVAKVQGFKSARGWSVDAADSKMLSVGGKKIEWTVVYATRIEIVAEMVLGLVSDEQATKGLRLREKTRLMTNAALCLSRFYPDVPAAQEKAKKLATDAVQQFEVDAESIKQLMPAFFTE